MIITKNSTQFYAHKYAGGKGHNLYRLSRQNFNVPEWKTLSAALFRNFCRENKIEDQLRLIVETNLSNLKEASRQIEHLITKLDFPAKDKKLIVDAYQSFKGKLIAVRSSAIGEDSGAFSFAGQLSTFLYIRDQENALLSIKKCWASAYSDRSLSYRIQNKINLQTIDVAVILQEMIDPDKSGVAFTCDPISGLGDKAVINAVYGVGEGLVSGAIDGDTYTVNKNSKKILEKQIVEKNQKMVQDFKNQSCHLIDVDQNLQNQAALSDSEITSLTSIIKEIEKHYHYPQDIEWAIFQETIYILQSRPVTTNVINAEGHLYIWDNSNIVESYGGLTKPLTFDFARNVYHNVYVQFCEILLVPPKQIKEMDYFLRNMLGCFYGRVYYNLLNWYKLTSILPGFKFNRQFMETMMGTNESLANEIADRIKPPAFQESFPAKIKRFITGCKFFYFHLTAQGLVDKFLKFFYHHYDHYRKINFSQLTPNEIIELYYQLERTFLTRWKAPIINDFLCMVHFGILKKLVEKWLPNFGQGFQNDLLCGDGNLESAMPTREVMRLAKVVEQTPGLKSLLLQTPSDDCQEILKQSSYQSFYQEIEHYLDQYGFRCMSEMKLEQRDLHHNPGALFTFIKNHLQNEIPSLEELEDREKSVRHGAEQKVFTHLNGVKKLIFKWSLKHARKAVRNRENTRFCRTRVYGIVRQMFYALGTDYANRGIIECEEDIFFLTFPELFGSIEGYCSVFDFKALINARKTAYLQYEDQEPAARFHTRGPVYWQNQIMPLEETGDLMADGDLPENCLRGIPCCAGIVEGVVKVIHSPEDDLTLNGEILVTKRTDPGWVPLYPSAKALLVERGGLLSHSAIVAREMGLPTIVSIKDLTKHLKTGMHIKMNGETGIIEIMGEKLQ